MYLYVCSSVPMRVPMGPHQSAEPEPGFDLGSTAGEFSMLTTRLHMLYIIVLINHQYACLYVIGITVYLYALAIFQ